MRRVNTALIAANVAAYFLLAPFGDRAVANLALWPLGTSYVPELGTAVSFRPWQLLTYAFMHGSIVHLLLNMVGLLSFGGEVERVLGARRYLLLYATSALTAALVQLGVVSADTAGGTHATVGASGAVFGVLLAFGTIFPRRMVMLVFPPIPMRAWLLVTIFGVISLANGVLGTQAGIAHFAHLGGMLGAWLLLSHWRRPRRPL
jgi:membrane associated rhomboid family serine protease